LFAPIGIGRIAHAIGFIEQIIGGQYKGGMGFPEGRIVSRIPQTMQVVAEQVGRVHDPGTVKKLTDLGFHAISYFLRNGIPT
jgi:hypothetical protein